MNKTVIKILILYAWLVRVLTFFLPEVPVVQAFRGWLYSFGMKKCGRRFRVSFNVVINHLEKITVDDNVYIACGSVITGGGEIMIGRDVLIGPNVILSSNNHKFNGTNFLDGYVTGKIVIEDGCWIGGNSTIVMGAHIRASSMVAAGSVCNKDYQTPCVLIGGVPGKVLKTLEKES